MRGHSGCFESAQLLLADSRSLEALPSLRGLVTIAARFEQMTSDSRALGLAVRLALDALSEELPGNNASRITAAADELLRSAAQAELSVPDTAPSPENTAIWQSLSDEMLLANRAVSGSYLIAGLHLRPGNSNDRADFHATLESGPSLSSLSPPALSRNWDLLRHAAPLFGWTVDTSTLESLLAQARQLNEASAGPAGPENRPHQE